ncbi:MAG: hypothetical protein QW356_05580 [Candidatus Hadarchaeales archaeon]
MELLGDVELCRAPSGSGEQLDRGFLPTRALLNFIFLFNPQQSLRLSGRSEGGTPPSEELTRDMEETIDAIENGKIRFQDVLKGMEEEVRREISSSGNPLPPR